jgi:ABC-2 type transport system ATP-binding protein
VNSISPAIKVVDLVKRYNGEARALSSAMQFRNFLSVLKGSKERGVPALNGVNLTINQGEIFGLLGPNGAGKTTLIKILSTLVLPDSGYAAVNGVDVVKHPRRVVKTLQSVLAEGIGFERRLTGRQNLEFYSILYGIPSDLAQRRIGEVLEFSRLQDKADVMFQRYSTGMARKLLVSRALLSDASILLFDEPTASLDPISAAEFRRLIVVLAKEMKKTVLLATHNLWEAQQICDRIALLHKGKLLAIGSAAEIRQTVADVVYVRMHLASLNGGTNLSVSERLSAVEGVRNAEIVQDGRVQGFDLKVEATKDMDYTALFNLVDSMGFRIASIETSQPSLEDAFLKLTREAGD